MSLVFVVIYLFVLIACSVSLWLLGKYIANGKGDALIAGYNMASVQEKAKYDIVRMRRDISLIIYIVATILPLLGVVLCLPSHYAIIAAIVLAVIIVIIPIAALLLRRNGWVKK